LREYGGVFLDVDFVGEGKVGFEQPGGEVTEGSQGKFVYGVIVKDIVKGPENIKDDDGYAEEDDEGVFVVEGEKIKKVFIPAGIYRVGV
jgi:hypothetical protein